MLPYDVLVKKSDSMYNVDNYVRRRVSDFQKIHHYVTDNLAASLEDMLSRQHKKARNVDLSVGDVATIQVHD